MNAMDANLKAKWIEALRGGEFKQCTTVLCDDKTEEYPMYCCLGVLCVVAHMPPDAESYAQLNYMVGGYQPLVNLNDEEGKSFPEIADWIEANIPALIGNERT